MKLSKVEEKGTEVAKLVCLTSPHPTPPVYSHQQNKKIAFMDLHATWPHHVTWPLSLGACSGPHSETLTGRNSWTSSALRTSPQTLSLRYVSSVSPSSHSSPAFDLSPTSSLYHIFYISRLIYLNNFFSRGSTWAHCSTGPFPFSLHEWLKLKSPLVHVPDSTLSPYCRPLNLPFLLVSGSHMQVISLTESGFNFTLSYLHLDRLSWVGENEVKLQLICQKL